MSQNEAYKIANKDEIKNINDIKIKEYKKIDKKRNFLENKDIYFFKSKIFKI